MSIDAKPGIELDRAVAEAIGLTKTENGNWQDAGTDVLPGQFFNPSADWNYAIWAAEKFGLFTDDVSLKKVMGDHWLVLEMHRSEAYDEEDGKWDAEGNLVVSSAPTGPHAICRAILILSSRKSPLRS